MTALRGHLISLGDGQFGMWRTGCVRGAGMPYDWLMSGTALHAPQFAEALSWQHSRVAAQLHIGPHGNRRARQLARTLASYRTRYCAKNDSIGFYGPITWMEWVAGDTEIGGFVPPPRGSALLELWAVQAVAETLLDRYQLWDWVVPHVAPTAGVTATGAHLFDGSRITLSERQRQLVEACDGFRLASEVVAACAGGADPRQADQAAGELRRLQAMGLITTGFAIAQSPQPERQLRAQLARVGDPVRREAALRELAEFTGARDQVTRAIGDPAAVAAAIERLGQVFVQITGKPARRRDGEFYAGRALVYEECTRPQPVRLSTTLLEGIGPALELLLISARWLSADLAARYDTLARTLMAADARRDGYPLPLLLSQLAGTFTGSVPGPADAAVAELSRRWARILLSEPTEDPRVVTTEAIRDQVRQAFPATAPGWPGARWHSPDLMIAAASVADIRAGRYLAVLGELHSAINALDQLNFLSQHPDPAGFRRAVDADIPSRITPLYPLRSELVNSRTAPPEAYHSPSYRYLGVSNEPSYAPSRARVVPVGALRVHASGGGLVVRSCVDDFEADLAEVLDDYLGTVIFNRFRLLPPRPYQSRIQIDRLVVSRETWRLPLAEFAELDGARLPRILAEMSRVREKFGLPNPAFCVVAGERKPVYLDFDDPSIVDMVWHKLRRGRARMPGGDIVLTEMLPGPSELWLHDAAGHRYTTELRLVCVDEQTYQRQTRPTMRTDVRG